MTFARKGIRRIVVRNETYHWKNGSGLTVERPVGGSRLHVPLTGLQHAEPENVADIIAYALDCGWEPNRPGKTFEIPDGISVLPEYPLWQAVRNGDATTVSALLAAGQSPNTRFQSNTMVQLAICQNHPEVLRLLLDAGAEPGMIEQETPPLIYAVLLGSPESVALLLAHGTDVHVRDAAGQTALSHVIDREKQHRNLPPNDPYAIQLRQHSEEIVTLLRRAGATE